MLVTILQAKEARAARVDAQDARDEAKAHEKLSKNEYELRNDSPDTLWAVSVIQADGGNDVSAVVEMPFDQLHPGESVSPSPPSRRHGGGRLADPRCRQLDGLAPLDMQKARKLLRDSAPFRSG